jgi:hypothetical protein
MRAGTIYSEFQEEIRWIQRKINDQLVLFSPKLRRRAEHYLKRRLRILPGARSAIEFDPALGKPVPYATFWFADALHLKDQAAIRNLALGLLYISLYTTITDDILDQRRSNAHEDWVLANFYFNEYVHIFQDLFPIENVFWRYLRDGRREAATYELWRDGNRENNSLVPLSEGFLRESSRYFVAVVLPTLAGVALLAGREETIPGIRRFLDHFSMGWRVFDDLSDWEKDLEVKDQNRSCVLGYISRRNGGKAATREVVLNGFLNPAFVKNVYRVMLGFLEIAKDDVMVFQNPYLEEFMDEQLQFHRARRDEIIRSGSLLRSRLNRTVIRATS